MSVPLIDTMLGNISTALSTVTETNNARQTYPTLLANLQAKDILISAKAKSGTYINVRDYGVMGDGVTDDTVALQAIIDSPNTPSEGGVMFFPSTGTSYNITQLIIRNHSDLKFQGTGIVHSWLKSTSLIPFSIQSNGFCIESMRIQGIPITSGALMGSIMFSDDRNTIGDNSDNLDFTLNNCYIAETERVLLTHGHGIIMDGNCFFDIRSYIIDADFPSSTVFTSNGTDNDRYATGFRGFMFRHNRVHFSPCCILRNIGTNNSTNLTGVLITDNQLEGSTGYIEGYVRHATIANNEHYQCGNVRGALFITFSCDDCKIDLDVSGATIAGDGVQTAMYCNQVINATGACNNLTITGNIRDVYKDCFVFTEGGRNININIVADNISILGAGYLVDLQGTTYTYDGLVVKGSVTSPNSNFCAVHRNSNNVVNYDISGLMLTGTYVPGANYPNVVYHNLNEQNQGTRRTVSSFYTGNGGATTNVYLGFKPNSVSVYSSVVSAIAISGINVANQTTATGITFTASGFAYQGIANNNGIVYSWIAN